MGRGDPLEFFTPEQVDRARRYHRPLYWSALADTLVGAAILVVLAFSPVGDALGRALAGVAWPVATMAWVAVIVVSGFVCRLLVSYWRGFVREHRWGFSTQSRGAWAVDRLKGLAVGFVLTSIMLFGLIGRVPEPGETTHFDSLEFTTESVTGRRIQKVVVTKHRTEAARGVE